MFSHGKVPNWLLILKYLFVILILSFNDILAILLHNWILQYDKSGEKNKFCSYFEEENFFAVEHHEEEEEDLSRKKSKSERETKRKKKENERKQKVKSGRKEKKTDKRKCSKSDGWMVILTDRPPS